MLSNGILWIYRFILNFYLAVSIHSKYLHYFLIILIQRYYRFTTRSFHSHKFASHFTISFHISLVISHTTKSNQMIWLCICYVQITKPTIINQVNPIIYLSCPINQLFLFFYFWQNGRRRPFWMGQQCQLSNSSEIFGWVMHASRT